MMLVITLVIIHTDAFRKNKFHAFLSYPFAKMNQVGGIAWKRGYKFMHTTEVLKISILTPLFDNRFIRDVSKMLENQQTTH